MNTKFAWIPALALVIGGAGALLAAKPAARAAARDWRSVVAVTPQGNPVMGNPAAPVKLIEYVSYACSHCADFVAQSRPRLEGDLVRRGRVSVERRPTVLQNQPFALVAALLVHCGPPNRWFGNGDMFLATQPQWLPRVMDPELQKKWNATPGNQFALTMARDLGFIELMQKRGYTPAQSEACLADKPRREAIMATTNYGFTQLGIGGTPSFLVNDSLMSFYDWPNLEILIDSVLGQ